MKYIIALFISLLTLPALASELVILLSWDGFRHDYMDRADFPALQRIESEGIRSKIIPGVPSDTFPGHVTLATGAHSNVHGIVANRFMDREMGISSYDGDGKWLDAEPLWVAAERQGVKAATFFWVSSETDWRGQRATYRIAPFDGSVEASVKVDQILDWIDLPEDERPRLIMSYWNGPDYLGHVKGPNHPDVVENLHEHDAQLNRLMQGLESRGLWPDTTLMIVSDHGMTTLTETVPVEELLHEAGISGTVVGGSSLKRVFLDDTKDLDSATALFTDHEKLSVFSGDDIPDIYRYPNRTGDFIVASEPPVALSSLADTFLAKLRRTILPITNWETGGHGFDPRHPDMAATFLVMGAGVDNGVVIDEVPQESVAATVTGLLGIEPPLHATGQPVRLTRE